MTRALSRSFDAAFPTAADSASHELRRRDLAEIWRGLAGDPKRPPCKLLYDTAGSHLFELITRQPEYYPTRTELEIRGSAVEFHFKGKSGKLHHVRLDDARLARIVRSCRDAPGQRLFQYAGSDGKFHAVTSGDVNDYLRRVTGEPFSAKDFRTWTGTLLAIHALAACEPGSSLAAKRRTIQRALEGVSAELGNTIAICRKSYVHPAVIDQYTSGEIGATFRQALLAARRRPLRGLRHPENVALRWLEALPSMPEGL
jgi:DNA topoisomerase IB